MAFLLPLLTAGLLGVAPMQDPLPRFRVDVKAAQIQVRVRDESGRVLTGLQADDFTLLEDGKERPITQFQEASQVPLSLAILIDRGASNSKKNLLLARDAVHRLIHLLAPKDRILLGVYGHDVAFVSELTSDRYKLVEGIENVASGGRSSKWARLGTLWMSSSLTGYAVDECLLKLKRSGAKGQKAVLVFSAGFGGIGEATLDHLHKAGTAFFGVSFGNRAGDIFSLGGDQSARKRIVRQTAGFSFDAQQMAERLNQLRDALKHSYRLAYSPGPGANWSTRRLQLSLKDHPKAEITWAPLRASGSSFY